ncbi:hypothetical protein CSOJ01_11084 [Colletotrichum sojae]|uniref:Uncharacterized protein n=1 Tax=Colletotrichum sojae TaxID=2175907 RepID=A0A8H6IYD9_9PEZI|nr:hypothetical protein CSOJ01_11084 [Colletotrichum sojae]
MVWAAADHSADPRRAEVAPVERDAIKTLQQERHADSGQVPRSHAKLQRWMKSSSVTPSRGHPSGPSASGAVLGLSEYSRHWQAVGGQYPYPQLKLHSSSKSPLDLFGDAAPETQTGPELVADGGTEHVVDALAVVAAAAAAEVCVE